MQPQTQSFQSKPLNTPSVSSVSSTWSPLSGGSQHQLPPSQNQLSSQQYISTGVIPSRANSNPSVIGSGRRLALTNSENIRSDPLRFPSQLLEEDGVIDSDGSIAAQLHRRDLEVQVLKLEVKRLTGLLQASHTENSTTTQEVYKVDPAVEMAFRNMAKRLKEKDGEVAKLQYHLEATMAAIGAYNPTPKSGINKASHAKIQFHDQGELAHRLVTRITALRDENKLLGVSSPKIHSSQ